MYLNIYLFFKEGIPLILFISNRGDVKSTDDAKGTKFLRTLIETT